MYNQQWAQIDFSLGFGYIHNINMEKSRENFKKLNL